MEIRRRCRQRADSGAVLQRDVGGLPLAPPEGHAVRAQKVGHRQRQVSGLHQRHLPRGVQGHLEGPAAHRGQLAHGRRPGARVQPPNLGSRPGGGDALRLPRNPLAPAGAQDAPDGVCVLLRQRPEVGDGRRPQQAGVDRQARGRGMGQAARQAWQQGRRARGRSAHLAGGPLRHQKNAQGGARIPQGHRGRAPGERRLSALFADPPPGAHVFTSRLGGLPGVGATRRLFATNIL
mmetsp:Transcript_73899/g.193839  ORF Transcript_73899/g.193839 Transcript_73899/m.193839 type:complete len:235 (-) Transcript_73899:221-925(-)